MRVAVLGATGLVGQKFIALLHKKLSQSVFEVVASERKYNRKYGDVCVWQEPLCPMPESVQDVVIRSVEEVQSEIIVSFLPQEVAVDVEAYCLSQGKQVFSNASAYRMDASVPIIIPEINAHHIQLLDTQDFLGRMITNPNCCVSGVALALSPLLSFGIQHAHVVTLQSISGAGQRGACSMDVLGNTIPYIPKEEDKIIQETWKILGTMEEPACFPMSVSVHRVPVVYGHTLTLHVTFTHPIYLEEVESAYQKKNMAYPGTYVLHHSPHHPQARKDLTDDDMRVHIGPIAYGGDLKTIKMNVLIHNLVRGAAGALLANLTTFCSQNFRGKYASSRV